jgi:flagellar motor switch protein FliG
MSKKQPENALPRHAADLDGVTKTAVLLVSLDHDAASSLLAQLPMDRVEEVSRRIAHLGAVPAPLAAEVVEEFYGLKFDSHYPRQGGLDFATNLIREAPGDQAPDVIAQLESQVHQAPFAFLSKVTAESILTFIQEEHPQTISLILSHLPNAKASDVLMGLPSEKQVEVVRRMANMEQTNPEVIRQVESGLAHRFASLTFTVAERVGGVETVAEVLNLCDRNAERTILEGVEIEDPELVEQIRRLMFVFEDLLLVEGKGIQAVLKEVDNDELCLALKTASEDLKEKIFANMSTRASELIKEEMEYIGPVRLSDVEAAQQRIVDIVRRLEDAGELIIAGRGGDGDVLV